MAVLAQNGYGRGDKVEQGLDNGLIEGVILSPRDERRERLEESIQQWRQQYENKTILFDPQFYAATLRVPKDGHLNEYEYYGNNNSLSRTRFSQAKISRYVSQCLDYQMSIQSNLSYLVAPNISFDGFRDSWSQIAINMMIESNESHEKMDTDLPLLISVVFSENSLRDRGAMEEYLDVLTELEVRGFYIIVNRTAKSLQPTMDTSTFANFLYFCHVLSLNDYKIIVGYSDWPGFMLEAVGADFTACGWYQNLRQFSMDRFQPRDGGRRPRKRYSSYKLLYSPLLSPELQDMYKVGILNQVLSGSEYDDLIINGPAAGNRQWTDPVSCFAHWFSLAKLSEIVSSYQQPQDRLREAISIIENANSLYRQLEFKGIDIDSSHLDDWKESINEFARIVNWKL